MLLEGGDGYGKTRVRALNSKFKMGLVHLAPILLSLLFGVFCASLILRSPMEIYGITPFPEGLGSLGNAFYFVILVGVGATILYLLLKSKNLKLIVWITGSVLTLAVFMLSIIYIFAAFSGFDVPNMEVIVLIMSLFITALADYAIFRKHGKSSDLVVILLGGALGTFLGFSIPISSAILILGFLAVYDVFAVYHGPVGKIARSGLDQLRGLSFSFRDIQMGLGDLTFYSMLSGSMLVNPGFGYISCLASIIGILFGCLLGFKILEKKGMFPGLPFPILFGLAAGLLVSLV
jgi:presenilin-like A22 family membrane protease